MRMYVIGPTRALNNNENAIITAALGKNLIKLKYF